MKAVFSALLRNEAGYEACLVVSAFVFFPLRLIADVYKRLELMITPHL